MKNRLLELVVIKQGEWLYVGDSLAAKNDPEGMMLCTLVPEDVKDLIATLKAQKARGKFGLRRHNNRIQIYTGKLAHALMPYVFGKVTKECYLACDCDMFYVPSIIKALEKI